MNRTTVDPAEGVEAAPRRFEIGLYSFAELTPDPETGRMISPAERLENLLEMIELADRVGLDVFGLGEHHRPDFVSSAPAVILAAAAMRSQRIRLSSAVTVLSSDDPVRVFQDFATLDQLSQGRAEIMAGRGSFIESFPLFGYDLKDYETLFNEKLDLFTRLLRGPKVSWSGTTRSPLRNQAVFPTLARPMRACVSPGLVSIMRSTVASVGDRPSSARASARSAIAAAESRRS